MENEATLSPEDQAVIGDFVQENDPDYDPHLRFYEHGGYFLTALWQNQANIKKLSEATGVGMDVLSDAVANHKIDLVTLSAALREDPDLDLGGFLQIAGLGAQEAVEMQPIPGVNLDEINAEQAALIHERTLDCPLCGEGRKQTARTSGTDSKFLTHEYYCKTQLDYTGVVRESKQCSRNVARKQR